MTTRRRNFPDRVKARRLKALEQVKRRIKRGEKNDTAQRFAQAKEERVILEKRLGLVP